MKRRYSLICAGVCSTLLVGCGGSNGPPILTTSPQTAAMLTAPRPDPWQPLRSQSVGLYELHRAREEGARFTVLYSFKGREGGKWPAGLANVSGTLYGTTQEGGVGIGSPPPGLGTIFAVSTSGKERTVYRFAGYPTDGASPQAGLINGNGVLYGATYAGGSSGHGTVYSVSATGAESVLYSFKGGSDGADPVASLLDKTGTLYGTTSEGGGKGYLGSGGTVFKISCRRASCAETVLHSFSGSPNDGCCPSSSLTNVGGALYGTTQYGGAYGGSVGNGTVFKIVCHKTAPCAETVLHSFDGSDGVISTARLTDVNGSLYGTTVDGGAHGFGTVFKITTSGAFSRIYSFAGSPSDGDGGNDMISVRGTLYGTTEEGGTYNCGTIFRITTSGQERVLHSFDCYSDPLVGVTYLNGRLYGTTEGGGARGFGTVYSLAL
jgi:uncharacterized repeat protein (TIGR03803 family)